MTVILAARFLENQSATSISYQQYHKRPQDIYPTFSICFSGTAFHWYNELAIFNVHELTSTQYERMWKGQRVYKYEYDDASKLFRKVPIQGINSYNDYFDHFRVAMSDILLEANFTTENMNHTKIYRKSAKNPADKENLFMIGYETPEMICFTRNSVQIENLIRVEDSLAFNKSLMKSPVFENTDLQIYVHYPGKLMQALNNPIFTSKFYKYQWDNTLEMRLLQVRLWRKRTDSTNACKSEILNDDLYLQRIISNKFGCIYPFWNDTLQKAKGAMEGNGHAVDKLKSCKSKHVMT